MVRFYLALFLILFELPVRFPALRSKIKRGTVDAFQNILIPEQQIAVFVGQNLTAMYIMLVAQIPDGLPIISTLTGDMFENRHYISPAIFSVASAMRLRSAKA